MKLDKNYAEFIQSLKSQIVQSQSMAARLINRVQLFLNLNTGIMIAEKVRS